MNDVNEAWGTKCPRHVLNAGHATYDSWVRRLRDWCKAVNDARIAADVVVIEAILAARK